MRAYVGLGSNMGDREAWIRAALSEIPGVVRMSSLYETVPVGYADQGLFLNAVAEVETDLPARKFLHLLLAIETRLGRIRGIPNGPRVIDLDLLFFGPEVLHEEGLIVPHPRYRERRFVLDPLLEIAPHLRDPETGELVSSLL